MAAEIYRISRMVNRYSPGCGELIEAMQAPETDYNDHVHLTEVWVMDDELCSDCSSPEIVVTWFGPDQYQLEKVNHDRTCPTYLREKRGKTALQRRDEFRAKRRQEAKKRQAKKG